MSVQSKLRGWSRTTPVPTWAGTAGFVALAAVGAFLLLSALTSGGSSKPRPQDQAVTVTTAFVQSDPDPDAVTVAKLSVALGAEGKWGLLAGAASYAPPNDKTILTNPHVADATTLSWTPGRLVERVTVTSVSSVPLARDITVVYDAGSWIVADVSPTWVPAA
jgi:hypothetical protein